MPYKGRQPTKDLRSLWLYPIIKHPKPEIQRIQNDSLLLLREYLLNFYKVYKSNLYCNSNSAKTPAMCVPPQKCMLFFV